jgi:hypothetical protein
VKKNAMQRGGKNLTSHLNRPAHVHDDGLVDYLYAGIAPAQSPTSRRSFYPHLRSFLLFFQPSTPFEYLLPSIMLPLALYLILSAVSGTAAASVSAASSASGTQDSTGPASGTTVPFDGGGGAASQLDQNDLVLRIDIVLLLIFGAFVLVTLPKFLATLWNPSHFLTGFCFRERSSSDFVGQPVRDYSPRQSTAPYSDKGDLGASSFTHSNESFNSQAGIISVPRSMTGQSAAKAPPRVRDWMAWTHPAAYSIIHHEVWPGVPFSKAIVLMFVLGSCSSNFRS